MSFRSSVDRSRQIERLFWLAIVFAALNAGYAALNARDLVYDGSFYLLAIASHRTFQLFEPARFSVQILQQMPVVLGIRLGIENLWCLGRLYSLAMSLCPVALTAMSWFALPRDEKSWIAGPLINLVFAIPATSFIGVGEGIIASCFLWLAVLLVMFRLNHPLEALAALVATIACAVSHESAVVCLVLISWLAASRVHEMGGFLRIAAVVIAIVAVLGVIFMARWIVIPRSAIERSDFAVSLLGGFLGSLAVPNLPAVASLLAALFVSIAFLAPRQSRIAATSGAIAVLACGIAFAVAPAMLASPGRFFAARAVPVAATTLLAALFVLLRRRGASPDQFVNRPAIVIVVALVVAQAVMQAAATNVWSEYVEDLRTLVATKHGAISHLEAMADLDRDQGRFRRELLESWSVEPLSILLAPGGRVMAVVEPGESARWIPYRLQDPETLPHVPQLDWSHFTWGQSFGRR
jgi:hypothetical protein